MWTAIYRCLSYAGKEQREQQQTEQANCHVCHQRLTVVFYCTTTFNTSVGLISIGGCLWKNLARLDELLRFGFELCHAPTSAAQPETWDSFCPKDICTKAGPISHSKKTTFLVRFQSPTLIHWATPSTKGPQLLPRLQIKLANQWPRARRDWQTFKLALCDLL